MKKSLSAALVAALALTLAACSDKPKSCTGVIKSMTDTTLVANTEGRDATFNITKARMTNGAIMPGDSVQMYYIGDPDDKDAKALVIRLIPHPGTVVNAVYDPKKELLTKPKEKE